jgi:glycerophosphoryl diester phosphodiesterase
MLSNSVIRFFELLNGRRCKAFFLTAVVILFSGINYAQVLNIAHRGGALLAPENTMAAFKNAIALKADYFELDVNLSKDDSLMIMHDTALDRTTNGKGKITDFTYSQLREIDAGIKFSQAFAGEKIPTLYEALEAAKKSGIGVVVEIKGSGKNIVHKIVSLIQKMEMQKRVIVSGFSLEQVIEAKKTDSTLSVQLFGTSNTNALVDKLASAKIEWYGSNAAPTKEFLDYIHSKGMKFNIWTINDPKLMSLYSEAGVDAVTTNNPLEFNRLFRKNLL